MREEERGEIARVGETGEEGREGVRWKERESMRGEGERV